MIDRRVLLAELQPAVAALEDDIRERVGEVEELGARLQERFEEAREAGRTAMALEQWREGEITQAAVAWVLACVFVRFLEDNELIDRPLLSGPGERRAAAAGQREEYFHANPADSDREYLEHAFRTVARYPAVAALYDERHNPLWQLGPTGDGAAALLALWGRVDPDTGALLHDFSSEHLDTRFLGDLYQDLSEAAKKGRRLLRRSLTEQMLQGDIFLNVPLGIIAPPDAILIEEGQRRFVTGPFDAGPAMLISPSCAIASQDSRQGR